MGSKQLFCLRWSNHQTNLLSVFDDLLQNEVLVDVTLACEGESLKAHKMVLSACSPYFQVLFQENPCKHPIVILKDIKFMDMRALVNFMYKGEVNVTQEQLNTLLKTAETLKIKGLAEVTGGMNGQQSGGSAASPPPQQQPSSDRTIGPTSLPLSLTSTPVSDRPSSLTITDRLATVQSGSSESGQVSPLAQHALSRRLLRSSPAFKINTSGSSPPLKRRKIRSRRRSGEPKSGGSDGAGLASSDIETVEVHGSPEILETKVDMPSESFDSGPGRPPDHDVEKMPSATPESLLDTSSQCSFRSHEQGPESVRSDDLPPIGEPLPAMPNLSHLSAIPKSKGGNGASTSSGGGQSQAFMKMARKMKLSEMASKQHSLIRAYEEVKSGVTTLNAAARLYGIHKSTLWRYMRKQGLVYQNPRENLLHYSQGTAGVQHYRTHPNPNP